MVLCSILLNTLHTVNHLPLGPTPVYQLGYCKRKVHFQQFLNFGPALSASIQTYKALHWRHIRSWSFWASSSGILLCSFSLVYMVSGGPISDPIWLETDRGITVRMPYMFHTWGISKTNSLLLVHLFPSSWCGSTSSLLLVYSSPVRASLPPLQGMLSWSSTVRRSMRSSFTLLKQNCINYRKWSPVYAGRGFRIPAYSGTQNKHPLGIGWFTSPNTKMVCCYK